MSRKCNVLIVSTILFWIVFLPKILLSSQDCISKPSPKPPNPQPDIQHPNFKKTEVMQKTKKLQMPFIANEGQTDERVMFYAHTFGGTVFVTKDGEIIYALPYRLQRGAGAHASNRPVILTIPP